MRLEDVIDYVIYERTTMSEERGFKIDTQEPFVHKWRLDDRIEFNANVVESLWDETTGKWKVKINQNGIVKEDEAEILVSATGPLGDDTYDWKNKRVAVIGNGASGIQTVTAMHSTSSKLVKYVRSPCWISPNFSGELTKEGNNSAFTEEEKRQFRDDPKAFFEFRKKLENSVNGFCYAMLKNHPFNKETRNTSIERFQNAIKNIPDPSIATKMILDFHPGCRRLTPGHGYLEAFTNPNTRMCWEPIERLTETGIRTADEKDDSFDFIVRATGFETTYILQWKLIGRNNPTLTEKWKQRARSILLRARRRPTQLFHDRETKLPRRSWFPSSWNFIHMRLHLEIGLKNSHRRHQVTSPHNQSHTSRSIDINQSALTDYNIWTQEYLKRTTWSDPCRSWYKNGKSSGQITAPYPGTTSHFKKCFETMGSEHFNIEYNLTNRFQFLGQWSSRY
ncbi:hypothetical protein ASPCADRAFT_504654 [Aspergillus carbonarius ITEM 5010]|uniref:L-ornithine N(5)-oxygenase n=1 Tax=Aspergillus carbonarius (strain ITEM 5010) TaxID=602072 RepID=A0A1R3RXE3_ASPC5|nr:hypothetical protein ASPCADRAFT_504654 [Aspergillus carbonarius ITEM 5010]